ncbi:hypothetical protein [Bdellovibrio sp.]|uniref:hypothetical protein n=1 Tax=Bdellovibrio TaxID=958 RepID=UPI003221FC88
MKTTIKLLGAMAAMMALSACAGGKGGADVHTVPTQNVSVDAAGNCSPDYVSKYNDMIYEARLLETQASMATSPTQVIGQLKALDLACQRFFAKHDNVSCKAELDGRTSTIKSSNPKPACNKAKEILKEIGH